MQSLELANRITEIIVDKQGEDVLILDLQEITPIADYFVICSATSQRQLDALQSAIREAIKRSDEHRLARNVEGTPESGWILIDYNGVVVHLFSEEMRAYYQLEDLWKDARTVTHIQ